MLAVPRAVKRGHYLAAFLMLAVAGYAVVVIPLAARIFETQSRSVQETREQGARQVTGFNVGRLGGEGDYGRAMEIASAREVYGSGSGGGGGQFARWMVGGWVVPAWVYAGRGWEANGTVVVEGVRGYTGELGRCGFLEAGKYRISEAGGAVVGNGTAVGGNSTVERRAVRTIELNGADEGCLFKLDLEAEDGRYDVYFGSGVYQCQESGRNGERPPVFFLMAWPRSGSGSGSGSAASLSLSTRVLKCRPSYRSGVGSLSISTAGSEVLINGFYDISSIDDWTPRTGFEKKLLSTPSSSASAAGGSRRVQASAFGNLVLSRFDITNRDPTKPWTDVDVNTEKALQTGLIESTQRIFQSVVLAALASVALEESKWPLGTKENLRTIHTNIDVERLFVVFPVAVTVLAVLFLLFVLVWAGMRMSCEIRDRNVSLPANTLEYHDLLHGCTDLHQISAGLYDPTSTREFTEVAREQSTVSTALFHVETEGKRPRLRVRDLRWRS